MEEQIVPRCRYFGKCAGCTAQHISYAIQVENKKSKVINLLQSQGIEVPAQVEIFYGSEYNYRNRMKFIVTNGGLGLRSKAASMQAVRIDECAISNVKINLLLNEVNKWLDGNKEKTSVCSKDNANGALMDVVIRASEFADSSTVTFHLNPNSTRISTNMDLLQEFANSCSASNVLVKIGEDEDEGDTEDGSSCFALKGSLLMTETIEARKFAFYSQSFFQNNSAMAQKMVQYLRKIAESDGTKGKALIDLYGGCGLFAISLFDLFQKVFIVDREGENIKCARLNADANLSSNVLAVAMNSSSIERLMGKLANLKAFMIADPPRQGMDSKVMQGILRLKPETLVYVSCNPSSMAKDIKYLGRSYTLQSLAVFDQFPQTIHAEAIAHLKIKSP